MKKTLLLCFIHGFKVTFRTSHNARNEGADALRAG